MDEIIKNLEQLGFTNYESRVFFALVQGHIMTPSEVAREAKIPRASAYDILKSFAEQGICNEILTNAVTKYELIDPKVVEDKIEKEIHETYRTKKNNLKDSFERLQPLFKAKEKELGRVDVELIKGFNRHRHIKFLNLLKSSNEELLLMNRLEGYVYKELDDASIDFYKRGGVVKSIYEASYDFKMKIDGEWKTVTPNDLVDLCQNFEALGERIKLSNTVPQNMAIFDRKVVFMSLVDPTIPLYNRSDIIVYNEKYAGFMMELFDKYWDKADTLDVFKRKLENNKSILS